MKHAPCLAVDFDGRIAEYRSDHDLARTEPRKGAREYLGRLRNAGFRIVIWTGRPDADGTKAWLDGHGIGYDAYNENPWFEPGSRKLVADMYIDDRGEGDPDASWKELYREVEERFCGPQPPRQPAASWDELAALAPKAARELSSLLVKAFGSAPRVDIKRRKRAEEKVEDDYRGDWSRLLDLVRATVVADGVEELYAGVAKLVEAGARYARLPEDRLETPLANGYRDYLANYRLPCGLVCEVQFHLPETVEAREQNHGVYSDACTKQLSNGKWGVQTGGANWREFDTEDEAWAYADEMARKRRRVTAVKSFVTKERGAPCRQGQTAARSGCIPANQLGHTQTSDTQQNPVMGRDQTLTPDTDLEDSLRRTGKVPDVPEQELLNELEATDGRGEDGGKAEGAGGGVAPEARGAGDETAGGEGAGADQSASKEAAKALPEVLKKLDKYAKAFYAKGFYEQAEWMEEFAAHIEDLGTDYALEALGEEKEARSPDNPIQYVGADDDIVDEADADAKFAKKYLELSGIQLVGAASDPDKAVVSGFSRANLEQLGRNVSSPGYVPTDQTFANKLEEAKHLPGLEKSEDIHKVVGKKVTQFTKEVIDKLDEAYGKNGWIVKSYGDEAYAGFGVYFPQRVKQIRADARSVLADAKAWLDVYGYNIAKKDGRVVGVKVGSEVYPFGTVAFNRLSKTVQKFARQAATAQKSADGAVLPSSPEDSIRNDYGITFRRDEDGVPTGIVNYDGTEMDFGSRKYEILAETDGYGLGHDVERALEADEWRRQGYDTEPKFMVQPAFQAVGASNWARANGYTWETVSEGRVHAVTRNGKASAVPFATLAGRHDALPVVFGNDDTRAMEKAVEDALNQLPESERSGQLYAPDVVKTKDGWKVIELNPSAAGGGSMWLGSNPYVIDALVSHVTGKEPQHVKFIRDVLRGKDVVQKPKKQLAKAVSKSMQNVAAICKAALAAANELYQLAPRLGPVVRPDKSEVQKLKQELQRAVAQVTTGREEPVSLAVSYLEAAQHRIEHMQEIYSSVVQVPAFAKFTTQMHVVQQHVKQALAEVRAYLQKPKKHLTKAMPRGEDPGYLKWESQGPQRWADSTGQYLIKWYTIKPYKAYELFIGKKSEGLYDTLTEAKNAALMHFRSRKSPHRAKDAELVHGFRLNDDLPKVRPSGRPYEAIMDRLR